jgi:hypothetical protein
MSLRILLITDLKISASLGNAFLAQKISLIRARVFDLTHVKLFWLGYANAQGSSSSAEG